MNVAALINKELPSMTKSEYKVAAYLLNSPSESAFATLEELAERIGTSTTSIIRFCRRLGHHGYKELQLSVRAELKSQPSRWGFRVFSARCSCFRQALLSPCRI